jgi:hypothetical protein
MQQALIETNIALLVARREYSCHDALKDARFA